VYQKSVKGVRVASANTGAFAWEFLPLAQIERIEIVRGPRAALYGSDAIGGVIQLFTRRAAGFTASAGAGNHGTVTGSAGFGTRNTRGRFGLTANLIDSAGFNAQNPRGFAFDPDDDGLMARSVSADAAYEFGALKADALLLHSDNDVEFDQGESASQNSAFSARLHAADWQLQATGAREVLETPAFFSRFETRRRQLDFQDAFALPRAGELLTGASLLRESGRVIDTFDGRAQYADDRDQQALFAAWRAGFAAFDWELATRIDDFDGFGREVSPQAALGWQANERLRLRANWGEGFRAPTLNELFSPGFGGLFAGNSDLVAEHARSAELAADFELRSWNVGARAYRTEVRDLVDFSGDRFRAINIGRARMRGIEVEWHWRSDLVRVTGNLGWQQAQDRDSGRALLRRPARKGNFAVEYGFKGGWLGAEVHATGPRPDFAGLLPGQALLGLTARWPLRSDLWVDLRIDNLLDRDYESLAGFNAPGMTALVQLRWQRD
jgi:vitamin B12 transporter